jgi:hypothetical protein
VRGGNAAQAEAQAKLLEAAKIPPAEDFKPSVLNHGTDITPLV